MAELVLTPEAARVLTEAINQIEELVIVLRDRLIADRAEESTLGNAVAGRVIALHCAITNLLEDPVRHLPSAWHDVYGESLQHGDTGHG